MKVKHVCRILAGVIEHVDPAQAASRIPPQRPGAQQVMDVSMVAGNYPGGM
ncbi:MAG: hypothetical protein RBU27_05470 [Bacteroidota bacterium]|jgi:hypothetical protein|nr:hypothetical protein [Bacteroidota bacterium]